MRLWEIYQEEPDSSFTHLGNKYDLNKLFRMSYSLPIKEFNVNDLKWILDKQSLMTNRVEKSDINSPILVTTMNNNLVVIDGIHRLKKAVNIGSHMIFGKLIPTVMLKKAIIK